MLILVSYDKTGSLQTIEVPLLGEEAALIGRLWYSSLAAIAFIISMHVIVCHSYLKYLSIMELFTDFFCYAMIMLQVEVTITGADEFPAVSNMLPAIYACADTVKECIKFRKQHDCEMADNSACFRIAIVKGKCGYDLPKPHACFHKKYDFVYFYIFVCFIHKNIIFV